MRSVRVGGDAHECMDERSSVVVEAERVDPFADREARGSVAVEMADASEETRHPRPVAAMEQGRSQQPDRTLRKWQETATAPRQRTVRRGLVPTRVYAEVRQQPLDGATAVERSRASVEHVSVALVAPCSPSWLGTCDERDRRAGRRVSMCGEGGDEPAEPAAEDGDVNVLERRVVHARMTR